MDITISNLIPLKMKLYFLSFIIHLYKKQYNMFKYTIYAMHLHENELSFLLDNVMIKWTQKGADHIIALIRYSSSIFKVLGPVFPPIENPTVAHVFYISGFLEF